MPCVRLLRLLELLRLLRVRLLQLTGLRLLTSWLRLQGKR